MNRARKRKIWLMDCLAFAGKVGLLTGIVGELRELNKLAWGGSKGNIYQAKNKIKIASSSE
jgi:hypothetical protein